MFSVLLFLSSSVCQQAFELRESYEYQKVIARPKEPICFNAVSPNTLILFKHFKHLTIVGQNQTIPDQQKLVGYFFGSSSTGSIEVVSSKQTTFAFISVALPQEIKSCIVSTLQYDQVEFIGSTPIGFFHARRNSTYAIDFNTDINSQILASKSQMKFSGKSTDYIKSSSELYVWLPSVSSSDSKVKITVGIPKSSSHKGYKFTLDLQKSGVLFAQCNKTDHHHGGNDNNDSDFSNDTIRYYYDNVFQNGSIMFPTIASLILTCVGVFFIVFFVIRFAWCCCQRRRPNSDNARVQIHERAVVVPTDVSAERYNANLPVVQGQPVMQMGNLPQQQLYYPVLEQPHAMVQPQQPVPQQYVPQPYPIQPQFVIPVQQQIPPNQYQQPGVYP